MLPKRPGRDYWWVVATRTTGAVIDSVVDTRDEVYRYAEDHGVGRDDVVFMGAAFQQLRSREEIPMEPRSAPCKNCGTDLVFDVAIISGLAPGQPFRSRMTCPNCLWRNVLDIDSGTIEAAPPPVRG